MLWTMSSVPQSYNTTRTDVRRNPYAPDLWIPYVMIGASCVTFLAVHFWCYHKRNRERYLRQRDEKRLKFGLLERRRITTLVLARCQSDLGINQSDTDIDLKQMYYDNCVDVGTEKKNNDSSKPCHSLKPLTSSPKVDKPIASTPNTDNTTNVSSIKDNQQIPKTISNSQTWPLVSECKFMPYNAHTTRIQDIKQECKYGDTKVINKNLSNPKTNYYRISSYERNCKLESRRQFMSLEISTDMTSINKSHERKSVFRVNREPDQPNPEDIYQPSSFSKSKSSVFYTNVSSFCTTPVAQITPYVKRKYSKRSYNGVSVERNEPSRKDQHSFTYFPFNKQESESLSHNRIYSLGSDDNFRMSENGLNLCFTHNSETSCGSMVRQDRFSNDSDKRTHSVLTNIPYKSNTEMIPFPCLCNNQSEQNMDSHSDLSKILTESSDLYEKFESSFQEGSSQTRSDLHYGKFESSFQEGSSQTRSCSYDDDVGVCADTNKNIGVKAIAQDIHISGRPQKCSLQGKNYSLQKRPFFNIPANQEMIPCVTFTESSTQTCFSDLHASPITKSDLSYVTSIISSSDNNENNIDHRTMGQNDNHSKESRIKTNQRSWNSYDDNETESTIKRTLHDPDRSARQTPRLRSLDPKLVFQHRKHEIKFD